MLLDLETWADQNLSPSGIRWPGIYIYQGWRRFPVQSDLNPDAPIATQSRHLPCPALAVDLRVGNAPASFTPIELWTALGLAWERLGGRWGGRFTPPDQNHFDVDPFIAGTGPLVHP